MKLSELTVGKEYAVVPSWQYSSRSSRDVNAVRENDVVKAELISLDKYEYEPSQRTQDPSTFNKAQQGNRSVGVLVKATDKSGTDIYWTSRLADIVALYSDLEPKWASAKADEEKREAEQKRKYEQQQLHREKVDSEVARSRNSVVNTAKELLGATNGVEVETRGYDFEYRGIVTLSLTEFEQLIELAYQGKSAVA